MVKNKTDASRPVKRYIVRFFHQDMGGCECPFEADEHDDARERRDEINAGQYSRMSDASIVRVYAKGK
jgi:hypothetical protein